MPLWWSTRLRQQEPAQIDVTPRGRRSPLGWGWGVIGSPVVLPNLIANYVTESVHKLGGVGPTVLFVGAVLGGIALMIWTWFHPTDRV